MLKPYSINIFLQEIIILKIVTNIDNNDIIRKYIPNEYNNS
ncbi:hypothetical protein [Spiroplasma corruscae]|nr:hypothetical protein [Spiroplasma corruscae]